MSRRQLYNGSNLLHIIEEESKFDEVSHDEDIPSPLLANLSNSMTPKLNESPQSKTSRMIESPFNSSFMSKETFDRHMDRTDSKASSFVIKNLEC